MMNVLSISEPGLGYFFKVSQWYLIWLFGGNFWGQVLIQRVHAFTS